MRNLRPQPFHSASLGKRVLLGASIALVAISLFLLQAGQAASNWSSLWMLRPMLIVPLAGAFGGFLYYRIDYLFYQRGWSKVLVKPVSLLIYLIGLWLGTILGLDGTMWN